MKELGIYVHIPFCVSKCKYCSFNSFAGKDNLQADYLKAVVKEIEMQKPKTNKKVSTIFIGGGTPSHFISGGISTIISTIKNTFDLTEDCEITVECNPNSVTYEKALEWKNAGVNRVSIGFQTSKNSILKRIGRTHNKNDLFIATNYLHSVGLDNINIDLMIGLPTQKQKDVKNALNIALKCGATHISAYTLILEECTPLFESVKSGEVKIPKEEKTLNMYNFLKKFLLKRGFFRYEVSNFSKAEYECKHNLNCWSLQEYIGIGAGAHGYVGKVRYSNFDDIVKYISAINDKNLPQETYEKLTKAEEIEEYIMLGLRKVKGINLNHLTSVYKYNLLEKKKDIIDKLISQNLIQIKDDYLFATDFGFNVLNHIILNLVY